MLYQLDSVKSQSSSFLCVEPIATLSKGTFVLWVSKEKWQWNLWIPVHYGAADSWCELGGVISVL